MRKTIVLLGIVSMFTVSLYSQSPRIVRNPLNMSSGGILNLIQEYQEETIPDDLGSRFDGNWFVVGVVVDTDGFVSCGYDPRDNAQLKRELHVSDGPLRRLADPICASVRTWKFRPLLVHGKRKAFFGPLVVKIQRQKFVLPDDPVWQNNPPPVKRK
ncbi:MAG: hypothetical protein WA741_33990 [Candidatus Sulfotelmatobacter sp.]